MGISRVVFDDETIIDLTQDTVTPESMLPGITAHNANGDPITGNLNLNLGDLANLDYIDYTSNYLRNKPLLGLLAALDNIDYTSNYLRNKPVLGNLASMNYIEYSSGYLTNKPDLHRLAFQDYIDYASNQLINKPNFGSLAFQNNIDYESNQLLNKPMSFDMVMRKLVEIYPDIPSGIQIAGFIAGGVLKVDSPIMVYSNETAIVNMSYTNKMVFTYYDDSEKILINILERLFDNAVIDYSTDQIRNKPNLGELASLNNIDYNSEYITNKPSFSRLAFQNSIDYTSNQLTNKPVFSSLAFQNSIDYESDQLINKPEPLSKVMEQILEIYPDILPGISLVAYASSGTLFLQDISAQYGNETISVPSTAVNGIRLAYATGDILMALVEGFGFIDEAPMDDKRYVRQNGQWVELT